MTRQNLGKTRVKTDHKVVAKCYLSHATWFLTVKKADAIKARLEPFELYEISIQRRVKP